MIPLFEDEVVLLRSLPIVLRGIKVRAIDKALVVLAKADLEDVLKVLSSNSNRPLISQR
ncbi:hypothetical protein IQ268_04255 [Oculatella sp. LEGE 06141]|uniref:hypothetical protein n=1 Tax=Oculatella sp. LEGE 06141 TaxID=1828648 RepID=UPI00187DEC7A|nr:hypothetical protein [Oculatella sp. LEGE 06141]MBE9177793.1 hypothetical protein [Oculatella sp. LEGE 06141]